MIHAEFYEKHGSLTGFEFSGHSGYADAGEDVVCAAVSSAVQLAVNILDAFGVRTDLNVGDNIIRCSVSNPDNTSGIVLEQLKLHFEAILEEYPATINITISEV